MIDLRTHLIMEANQKRPSGLGKIKDNSKETDVEFIAGDIYDLSDSNRYTEKFKYYRGDGNGYITDKNDHVYDVVTSESQGDAGRIAGGSTSLAVTIKNVAGVNLRFSGWCGIFSSSHGMDIISDIKAGMYLEDYIAKHWNDMDYNIRDNKDIIKLKEVGNAEAKTYNKQKEEAKEERDKRFWERYVLINELTISIKNGEINIDSYDINKHYKQNVGGNKPELKWDVERGENTIESINLQKEWNDAYDKYKSSVIDALKPVVSDIFSKKFGCTLSEMNGLKFSMVSKGSTKITLARLGFDTKKKQFVELDWQNPQLKSEKKYANEHVELTIGPTITLVKNDANERMIEIFTNASNEYMKLNKGKQSEWVKKNWEQIWQSGRGMYPWNSDKYTKGQARQMAAEDYKKELAAHKWETSGKTITFMTEFISQFMTAPEKIERVTGQEVENSPAEAPKKERGKNTKLGNGAYEKQEVKMDAWHNGERKQNVSNCSDAKLKLNYQICKDKGYEKEAAQLKAEAEKRGIVLEALQDYIIKY